MHPCFSLQFRLHEQLGIENYIFLMDMHIWNFALRALDTAAEEQAQVAIGVPRYG